MVSFLDRMTHVKRHEIARKKETQPLDMLMAQIEPSPPRDFRGSLLGGERIIAELKKRSPKVDLFEQADSISDLAPIYEENGASAVSVVTDVTHFGMSLTNAREIRNQIGLPVLVKDFVFDPYQVYEARSFGADALLLIARLLDQGALERLLSIVSGLGMSSLVEVHSNDEVRMACDAGAEIIGINNRNLDTLEVSLDTTRRLVDGIAGHATVVSESGISTRAQIEELSLLGVDAFLVGGALLSATNPGATLRALLGR